MADNTGNQDPSSLDEFSDRLDAARKSSANDTENDKSGGRGQSLGRGFRLASELLAAMIVGILLGMGIDAVANTSPWGLLAGIFIGFSAGLRNAIAAFKTAGADADDAKENAGDSDANGNSADK